MDAGIERIEIGLGGVEDGDGDVVAERGELITNLTAEDRSASSFLEPSDDMQYLHLKNLQTFNFSISSAKSAIGNVCRLFSMRFSR